MASLLIRYFVSYASKDKRLAGDLMDRLEENLKASAKYRYQPWADWQIVAGDDWHTSIQKAIQDCQFGILMISLPFVNSGYIDRYELPNFVASQPDEAVALRKAIPVGLKVVDFQKHDIKGLQKLQIFRDENGRFYSLCRGNIKDKFALELFKQIEQALERHFMGKTAGEEIARAVEKPNEHIESAVDYETHLYDLAREGMCESALISRAKTTSVREAKTLLGEPSSGDSASDEVDALDFLTDWVTNTQAPPFCALLGEYGIGKTTACKLFSQRLLESRGKDKRVPLPIYIDLRLYTPDSRQIIPPLEQILQSVLERSWKGGQPNPAITPEQVIRLVQQEGAVILFDGLDEVVVHLSLKQAQDFIRQLWRVLPPALHRQETAQCGWRHPAFAKISYPAN